MSDKEVLFLPLGGAGEIGMNLNLYQVKGKWLMIDVGVSFGDRLGVEVFMPDPKFITQRAKDLVGIVITHAHEDHIGALPYLWSQFKVPIYTTAFTAQIAKNKLAEAGLLGEVEINVIPLSGEVEIGPFNIELVSLTHSIPEPNAVAIHTDYGTIFHTGDWKIDENPLIGENFDQEKVEKIGKGNVLSVVCDSTNVFEEKASGSEGEVYKNILALFEKYQGEDKRLFVTCFSSNIARLASIALAAQKTGRQVALMGRSLNNMTSAARETGYFKKIAPFISVGEASKLPRSKSIIITSGSQGETRAGLMRLAQDMNRDIKLIEDDVVIFSSRKIPGNEARISKMQNELVRKNVEIITPKNEDIHVSGHPGEEELLKMYEWVKPKCLVPVHGELRHLKKHTEIGKKAGIPHSVIPENGTMIRLAPGDPQIVERVHSGRLALDGNCLIPDDHEIFRERIRLCVHGTAMISIVLDVPGETLFDLKLSYSGFELDQYVEEEMSEAMEECFLSMSDNHRQNDNYIKEELKKLFRRMVSSELEKKPVTHVHVIRVDE